MTPMTWRALQDALRTCEGLALAPSAGAAADSPVVTGIAYDSRAVTAGQVFVALKGQHADGVVFAREAIARGAAAIVAEEAAPADVRIPWLVVADARLALAALAAAFHGDPSREMRVIGITGTNGKTTTAYLVASIFEAAGVRCGVLGTVGVSSRRRDSRSDAHHARSAGPAGDAARDGRLAGAAPARSKCPRTRCPCGASTG